MKTPKNEWTLLSEDEVRRRLITYRGSASKYRPKPGTAKSTKIRIRDIALLSYVDRPHIFHFISGKMKFGKIKLKRLSKILILADSGRITKSQFGVYHFHDEPQAKPVSDRRLNIDLIGGKVSMTLESKRLSPSTFPDFSKIFGGK